MLLDAWRLAVGTLTAIPVAPPALVDRQRAGMAMMLAPIAAAALGAAVVLVALGGTVLDLPTPVVALLAVGAAIVGNRAFHLDGLSDTVDGLAASYDRERSLAVMKTGTSGPAGVVAVVLVIALQSAGMASILTLAHGLRGGVLAGVAICVSRAALAVCCLSSVPSARPGGLGDTYARTIRPVAAALVWLVGGAVVTLVGWWAGLAWWRGVLAVALGLVVVAVVLAHAIRRLGGVTGDVFGAAVELALATLLVALS